MTSISHTTAFTVAPPPATGEAIADAYRLCAAITRDRARNFYYGLRITPEPRRSAIYAVYAWLRHADDEADNAAASPDRASHLARRRAGLERLLRGEPAPAEPVWIALADTLRRYPIDPRDLVEMLDGLDEDTRHGGYETREELERYCRRVASTVGLICIAIWGLRPGSDAEHARALAVRRGVAFQLTNILRDFSEDFDAGRVYLPAEDFRRHDLTPAHLRRWERPAACEAMVRSLAAWARAEYDACLPLDDLIDPACAPTSRAMLRIYSGILHKIEARPERLASDVRIRLHAAHKAMIALGASFRARVHRP
ncbi:MAG: phytoene/squalene synthase family protein [Phycisphaerales bacterium]|nr:phytoene/squalene synthase family protein [Phycisphaerales bacterium]